MITITELVEKLNSLKVKYGDLEVKLYSEYPNGVAVDYVEFQEGDKASQWYKSVSCTWDRKDPIVLQAPGPHIIISY